MLQSRNAPAGLGQQAHLQNVFCNRNYAVVRKCDHRQRCVTPAVDNRLESLIAATAVALLVESSAPYELSSVGFAPLSARGAEEAAAGAATLTLEPAATAAAKGAVPASAEPAPALAATAVEASGANGETGPVAEKAPGGFWGIFSKKKAVTPDLEVAELPQQPPAATAVAEAPERQRDEKAVAASRAGRRGVTSSVAADLKAEVGSSSVPEVGGDNAGGPEAAKATASTDAPTRTEGETPQMLRWALERAALVVVGGVVGIGVVRAMASPANRAVDADVAAAALRAAKSGPPPPAPRGGASSASSSGSPPQGAIAEIPHNEKWDGMSQGTGRKAPSQRPPPDTVAGRWAGRGPPGQGPGRGPWPPASPGPSPPTDGAADAAASDYAAAYPHGGPYYGPPPPPWWRDPYAEYGMPYGPPPPPWYAWEESAVADDAGPGPVPPAQDPYQYYYGAPGGYWGWDAAWRWGPRPPSDGPYSGYGAGSAPPLPKPRGFAGMRASPATRLGRNPWAAVEQEGWDGAAAPGPEVRAPPAGPRGRVPGRPMPPLAAVAAAEAAAPPTLDPPTQEDGRGANAAGPRLQVGEVGGEASAVAGAGAQQAPPRPGSRRLTVAGDWRRQLQEEETAQAGRRPDGTEQRAEEVVPAVDAAQEQQQAGLKPKQQQRQQGRQRQPHSAATTVSPSADQEYERLLQLWREVNPEEEELEELTEGPETVKGNDRVTTSGSDGNGDSGVRGRTRGEVEGAGTVEASVAEGQQQQQPRPKSSTDATPQPPAVMNAHVKSVAVRTEAKSDSLSPPLQQQQQQPSSSKGGGGPIGWFARLFQGLTGGGTSADKSEQESTAAQEPREDAPAAPLQEPGPNAPASEMVSHLEEQWGSQPAEAAGQREEQEQKQMHANAQQQTRQEAKQEVAQEETQSARQRQIETAKADVAEQEQAGAALAAAVEAALQGQLAEQQQAKQQAGRASTGGAAVSAAPPSSPVSQPRVTVRSTGAGAAPRPPSLTQSKESIQQLRATSAAAADRAAETLARIRAMRAAAQAAGSSPRGSPRSSPSTSPSRNSSSDSNGNGTSLLSGNGKSNATADGNGHAQAKLGGSGGAVGNGKRNGKGSGRRGPGSGASGGGAEGDGAPGVESAAATEGQSGEGQQPVGPVRQAAEVH